MNIGNHTSVHCRLIDGKQLFDEKQEGENKQQQLLL